MTTPKRVSAAQKKKRLEQLRDAQRRRRERLKEESQFFVQIILPEKVLVQLRQISADTGETLQHIIGRLVEQALPLETEKNSVASVVQNNGEMPPPPLFVAPEEPLDIEAEMPSCEPVAAATETSDAPRGHQLDLFG